MVTKQDEDDFLANNLLVHIEGETCFELEHFQNRFIICPPRTSVKLRLCWLDAGATNGPFVIEPPQKGVRRQDQLK
jgi:hypothetical protein